MDNQSGAMYVQGVQVSSAARLSEEEYLTIADGVVDDLGWSEELIQGRPEAKRMWLETYPRDSTISGLNDSLNRH